MKTNISNPYGSTQQLNSGSNLDVNNNASGVKTNRFNSPSANANATVINTSFNVFEYQKSEISPVNSCQESTVSSSGSSSSSSYESKSQPSLASQTAYNSYGNFHQPTSIVNQDVNYFRQYSSTTLYGKSLI